MVSTTLIESRTTNQSTSTSSPTTHLTSLRTCQIRSADASSTSRMTKKSSTKLLPSMQMHSNPAATRKTYITATSNQKRANVTDSATSYGSTHHSAKNVSTNVGQKFLKLIAKHFPKNSRLHKYSTKTLLRSAIAVCQT